MLFTMGDPFGQARVLPTQAAFRVLFYVLYALTSPYVGYNGKERQYTQYQGSG